MGFQPQTEGACQCAPGFFFASELGVVSLIADQAEWRVISSREFKEKIYATPVIDRDKVFIRTEKALYCFEGKSARQ